VNFVGLGVEDVDGVGGTFGVVGDRVDARGGGDNLLLLIPNKPTTVPTPPTITPITPLPFPFLPLHPPTPIIPTPLLLQLQVQFLVLVLEIGVVFFEVFDLLQVGEVLVT